MEKHYIFTNSAGSFVFDEKLKLIENGSEKALKQKYKTEEMSNENIKKILHNFRRNEYYSKFREDAIKETEQKIRKAANEDVLIVNAIDSIEETGRISNTLAKRVREWYELYCPEFSRSIESHEKFIELILKKSRKELMKEIGLEEKETLGGELRKEDLDAIMELAKKVQELYILREYEEKYLEKMMKKHCPNVTALTGYLVGAKLLAHAGTLKRLSEMPASTIQVLGAEKALFRHKRSGAKSPKHGLIFQHPFFSRSKMKNHGKIARILSDKISIAAKVDYFKGEPIGDTLRYELEKKFGGMLV